MTDTDKLLKSGKFPKVLYIFGEEEFLIEEALEKILDRLCPDADSKYDYDSVNAQEAGSAQDKEEMQKNIASSCTAFPFVNARRVVTVRNFDNLFAAGRSKKKKPSPLKSYLENPSDTTALILTGEGAKFKGLSLQMKSAKLRQKALTAIEKAAFPWDILLSKYEWMEFPKIYESRFFGWIVERFKLYGKEIKHEAAELLLAHCNPELREINNEIQKVLLYVQDRSTVTYQDVNFIVSSSRVNNVFELQKAVGKRDIAKTAAITENILSNDDKRMLILTILTTYFTKLWKLSDIAGRESNNYKLAGAIGVSPFFVSEYLDALKNYPPGLLDNAFTAIAEAEEILKSSSTNSLYVLENMYLKIMDN